MFIEFVDYMHQMATVAYLKWLYFNNHQMPNYKSDQVIQKCEYIPLSMHHPACTPLIAFGAKSPNGGGGKYRSFCHCS